MKKNLTLLTLAFSIFLAAGTASAQSEPPAKSDPPATSEPSGKDKAADINGKWTMTVDAGGQIIDLAVEFKQTKDEFIGTMASMVGNGTFEKGKVTGNDLKATLQADVQGNPTSIEMAGKLDGEKITGTLNVPGMGVVSFTAARVK